MVCVWHSMSEETAESVPDIPKNASKLEKDAADSFFTTFS